jgi:hypothetical protein
MTISAQRWEKHIRYIVLVNSSDALQAVMSVKNYRGLSKSDLLC